MAPEVYIKVWKVREGEVMVAVCDCDILGKKVREGAIVFNVSKDFYGGERVCPDAAIDLLRKATVANLVGREAVKCGIEAGLVHEDAVITIEGIPHAQFVQI